MTMKILNAGDILFHEWEEANALYIIQTGSIEVYQARCGNEEILLGELHAEDILGEMAIFENEDATRMASARALEPTQVVVLIDFAIQELTHKHPEILDKIAAIIVERKEKNASFAL